MAMYDAEPIATRRPIERTQLPGVRAGRPRAAPGRRLTAAVVRVAGDSVVLRMDEPFQAGGLTQRLYYSNVHELTKVESVGRMGARDLFRDEDDEDE